MLDSQPVQPSATPATFGVTPMPGTAPAPAPAAPAPQSAQAPSTDWTSGFSDDLKGYVQNKGFKDPGALLDSYRNLEKLRGIPEDKLMRMPEADDAQGWNTIYQKLGRPSKAEEYKFQMEDKNLGKWAQSAFHEIGLSEAQANKLVEKWNGYNKNVVGEMTQAQQAKIANEQNSLKAEWGAAYDQNISSAQKATQALGFSTEMVDALEKSMGFAGVVKLMHQLGSKLGEGSFVDAGRGGNFGNIPTPHAAKARISELMSDSAFAQKLMNKDAKSVEEWNNLHKWANPQ